jgi:hypothetical protein
LGYDLLLIGHVFVALVGFIALGVTGASARALRHSPQPWHSVQARRYFSPGRNLAEFALYLVPVFGIALGSTGDRDLAHYGYPWIGLGIWLVAIAVATGIVFPAERRVQQALAGEQRDLALLVQACRRCEGGAALTSLLFVAAMYVMIAQPI